MWAETKAERVKMMGYDEDDFSDLVMMEEVIAENVLEVNEIVDD